MVVVALPPEPEIRRSRRSHRELVPVASVLSREAELVLAFAAALLLVDEDRLIVVVIAGIVDGQLHRGDVVVHLVAVRRCGLGMCK